LYDMKRTKNLPTDVRILVRVLAAGDATWLPDRQVMAHRRHTVLFERRSVFHASGSELLNGPSGLGSSDALRRETARAVDDLVARGLLVVNSPKWARALAYKLTEDGDTYARALCGHPPLRLELLQGEDEDPLTREETGVYYDRDGAHTFTGLFGPEVAMIAPDGPLYCDGCITPEVKRLLMALEEVHLPLLVCGLLVSASDVEGRVWYAVTPPGRALLESPPAASTATGSAALPEALPEAAKFYHASLKREMDRLAVVPPRFPGTIGEVPIAAVPLKLRPGAAEAWAALRGEPAPAAG
jgi:hypothetical protein